LKNTNINLAQNSFVLINLTRNYERNEIGGLYTHEFVFLKSEILFLIPSIRSFCSLNWSCKFAALTNIILLGLKAFV